MAYRIEFRESAVKELKRLDRQTQLRLQSFLLDKIAPLDNPRCRAEPLYSHFGGLWRFRVGDYRIVCEINDEVLVITAVRIGHRREVYRD